MNDEPRPMSVEDVLWLTIGYIESIINGIDALDKLDIAQALDHLLIRLNNLKTESEEGQGHGTESN
jgi:hypothetical protein